LIYVTIHDDSIEGTLKDMTVRVDDNGNSSEVSHRVQEKTNELLMGWERKRMEVMPDE
jgi:hypothetical protein